MEKILTVYKNNTGHIYFIDNSIDYLSDDNLEADYIMVYDESICLFNEIKKYQDEGYKIIFK